jgi:16S rRNA G966 N2-methylase RsmD
MSAPGIATVSESLNIQALQEAALKLWEIDQTSALELGRALVAVRDVLPKRAFADWFREAGMEENRVYYCIRKAEGKINPPIESETKPLWKDFVAPPFSVLDAAQGYWQERKRFWEAHGACGTHSRQIGTTYSQRTGYADTSEFDPVLAECMCLWFCPPKGRVLDPFAGESAKGMVAAHMGLDYLGLELDAGQVRENEEQAKKFGLSPQWLVADSARMSKVVPEGESFDLVFTSPPYYDLEQYSESEKDGSAKRTYSEFMEWYKAVFAQAVARLKWNRFLIVKVGEIRDKKTGFYRNFVGDNISCFLSLGLHYCNEMILHTSNGSAPIRARLQMSSHRKVVKTHQTVLCFFKGDDPTVLGNIERKLNDVETCEAVN